MGKFIMWFGPYSFIPTTLSHMGIMRDGLASFTNLIVAGIFVLFVKRKTAHLPRYYGQMVLLACADNVCVSMFFHLYDTQQKLFNLWLFDIRFMPLIMIVPTTVLMFARLLPLLALQ